MEGGIAGALILPSHAEGISERGSPRLALDWLSHSYCIARPATLGCSFSPWRNMRYPGIMNMGMNRISNTKVHVWLKPKCSCRGIHCDWTAVVQDWTHEGLRYQFSWPLLGTATSPNVLTRACAICHTSPHSHSLEKHLFSHTSE